MDAEKIIEMQLQLQRVAIDLAGWLERVDLPADIAAEMGERLVSVNAVRETR